MKKYTSTVLAVLAAVVSLSSSLSFAQQDEFVLSESNRDVPGVKETAWIVYRDANAQTVQISGSFNDWLKKINLQREGDLWKINFQDLTLPEDRYEFKFIVDGTWEGGGNRVLYVNPDGLLERPPSLIKRAFLRKPNLIQVDFSGDVDFDGSFDVAVEPDMPIARKGMPRKPAPTTAQGVRVEKGLIKFVFNPADYGAQNESINSVVVAGPFTGWDSKGQNGRWSLHREPGSGHWTLTVPLVAVVNDAGGEPLDFKFVVDGHRWMEPPLAAANREVDSKGNANLRIEPLDSQTKTLLVELEDPVQWDAANHVVVSGVWKRPLRFIIDPLPALDAIASDKPMGVTRRESPDVATYRVFAPRASEVSLVLYDQPYFQKGKGERVQLLPPAEAYKMWKDPADGVWEISLLGWDLGRYYAFRVDGPQGAGEGFRDGQIVGDPYADAAAHAENLPVLIDLDAETKWFDGWTTEFKTPNHEDLVIYEAHVRDLTSHPSSPVPEKWKGTYKGVEMSLGTGTGLDHLKELGVNAIEFMPLHEFNNGPSGHDWGYTTVYFFAPEASYASEPLKGSQAYELKSLVNTLHEEGFAVLVDVVYNHVGHPNLFASLDRKYYFRLNPDYTFQNFSGVGNDTRSEAPMMRRLIIESVLHWMTEYKIDGFRFDLAELIDMETLLELREEAVKINPNVILISEPWSFRGTHKFELTGTGWAAWNDDFRYRIKDFVHANAAREDVMNVLAGSTNIWTANPMQAVNYVESHDDMAVVDELSLHPDKDARNLEELDGKIGRLAATAVFTSMGIPMIHAGQEYLRSKWGIKNTYNKGDAVNSLNWEDRERPIASETLDFFEGLIKLRLSEAGKSFRRREIPDGYIRWILPEGKEHALGMVLNEYGEFPGDPFVVLFNAHAENVPFEFSLAEGEWVLVSDGVRVVPQGIPGQSLSVQGFLSKQRVDVPGVGSMIFRRE